MIYRIPLENGTVDVCGEPNKFFLLFDPELAEKRMAEERIGFFEKLLYLIEI